jgi:anti-sigma regulatory factor (Ser/Thr protein kinase)
VVWEWELRERADTVELVVSELVTNAVQASEELGGCQWHGQWIPGPPPVRLWLQADDTTVLMQVWDGSDRMPRRQEPESYGESGRGLILVEALCGQYGVYVLDGASGKVVWGEVAV